MSVNHDYTIHVLAHQRHQELTAAAARDRLASIALSQRQPWWRRLSLRAATSRRFAAVSPDGRDQRSGSQCLLDPLGGGMEYADIGITVPLHALDDVAKH